VEADKSLNETMAYVEGILMFMGQSSNSNRNVFVRTIESVIETESG
jgi:hypothetical protein